MSSGLLLRVHRFKVQDSGFKGSEFKGSEFKGSGFKVQGSKVQGSRVQGSQAQGSFNIKVSGVRFRVSAGLWSLTQGIEHSFEAL
jgi:hypothetical protein